jgi:hypothetical protein
MELTILLGNGYTYFEGYAVNKYITADLVTTVITFSDTTQSQRTNGIPRGNVFTVKCENDSRGTQI